MITNQLLKFPIIDGDSSKSESAKLKLRVQNEKGNYLIHRAFVKQFIESRNGNANTKTRSEVRGGGRKPWQQKGTGRARAGSNRSPLWKGGGVTFGPKTKTYKIKLNKKEWRLALQTLLFNKKNSIRVIKSFSETFERISKEQGSNPQKTKTLLNFLNQFVKIRNLNSNNIRNKILIVVPKKSLNLISTSQNLKNIYIIAADNLNIKSLLDSKYILLCTESLKIIEETYGKA